MNLRDRTYRLSIHRTRQTATEARFFIPVPQAIEVSRLRIEFVVEKNLGSSPNTCKIKLTNASPATRAELERDGVIVFLDAGYDGVARRLFGGDVTYAYSQKVGTDWVTEVEVGDGSRAIAEARPRQFSYKGGVTVLKLLRECASSMGLVLPKNVEVDPEMANQFATGYVFSGRTRDELTRLLAPYGYSWSVQNGTLQILRDDEVRVDLVRPIKEDAGMIGSPVFGKPEKKGQPPKRSVKNLLYPELNPGGRVNIESRRLNGVHKIERVKHTGDSEGTGDDSWTTEVEVKSI